MSWTPAGEDLRSPAASHVLVPPETAKVALEEWKRQRGVQRGFWEEVQGTRILDRSGPRVTVTTTKYTYLAELCNQPIETGTGSRISFVEECFPFVALHIPPQFNQNYGSLEAWPKRTKGKRLGQPRYEPRSLRSGKKRAHKWI